MCLHSWETSAARMGWSFCQRARTRRKSGAL
jgi:hypothetical protein